MAIKTYSDQVIEHINFLRVEGLDVDELEVGLAHFIRCREIGEKSGRPAGELAYKTMQNKMQNDRYVGLKTICRGKNGRVDFETYGLKPCDESLSIILQKSPELQAKQDLQKYAAVAKKAYGVWINALTSGGSDYLDHKGVGSYGIRFKNNEHGRVAVIPMYDIDGKLWSYQWLNPKSKLFAKGARVHDLFHFLKPVVDGEPFGVAESYVTAATCVELIGLPMVCVFSSNYIKSGSLVLRERYPNSKIIFFADNDRHLKDKNIGVLKAQTAREALRENVDIAIPDFGNIQPSKDASDWNDLVRLCGAVEAKRQLKNLGILQD